MRACETPAMVVPEDRLPHPLTLSFHGRVLDHLGLQMYQSPVAALAELVANGWDADATEVRISLPADLSGAAEIVVEDDGCGMTYDQIQDLYLKVGDNRRQRPQGERSASGKRPALGRKGIGKFAGFGIATVMEITTTSEENGERTTFVLDIEKLRTGDLYVDQTPFTIDVTDYSPPDENRKAEHGTRVVLRDLKLKQRVGATFPKSMARRFLLHQRVADFRILVDGDALPEADELEKIEYVFPRDYADDELPDTLEQVHDDGWGTEGLPDGNTIRWRLVFYRDTIDDEELTGVSVFARGKLAQTPFFFNLSGGLGGQVGQSYLSGRVEADYLDELSVDLIATERQRVNWEDEHARSLLEWGQARVRALLRLWQDRRNADKRRRVEGKLDPLGARLERLPSTERAIVRRALLALARLEVLNLDRFMELADAVLTAWEGGRLRELIERVSETDQLDEAALAEILLEANALTALQTAEAVKVKLLVLDGLHQRISNRELENRVRDYIAKYPWLVDPQWETFTGEHRAATILATAATAAKLNEDDDWKQRVDLTLSDAGTLVVVEFMRPGLTIDWDHVNRFERYVREVRVQAEHETGLGINRVVGYVVADNLARNVALANKIRDLEREDMLVMTWDTLLRRAAARQKDYFRVLVGRDPDDARLRALAEDLRFDTRPDTAPTADPAPPASGNSRNERG